MDESVNYCLIKYSSDKSLLVGEAIMSTTEVLKITKDIFDKSWILFKEDKKNSTNGKMLSFTDCTSVVMIKTLNIEHNATFDSRFRKYTKILDV